MDQTGAQALADLDIYNYSACLYPY